MLHKFVLVTFPIKIPCMEIWLQWAPFFSPVEKTHGGLSLQSACQSQGNWCPLRMFDIKSISLDRKGLNIEWRKARNPEDVFFCSRAFCCHWAETKFDKIFLPLFHREKKASYSIPASMRGLNVVQQMIVLDLGL